MMLGIPDALIAKALGRLSRADAILETLGDISAFDNAG
jgi:hypothetical protein